MPVLEHPLRCNACNSIYASDMGQTCLTCGRDGTIRPNYEAELERLRGALVGVREVAGAVCTEYEVCEHPACQASYGAWAVADEALNAS